MIRIILALLLSIGLTGCLTDENTSVEQIETVSIVNNGETVEIDEEKSVNVSVTSLNSVVTIKSDVKTLTISGSNNIVAIVLGVNVESIQLSGNDNTLTLPANMNDSLNDTGSGNTIIPIPDLGGFIPGFGDLLDGL